VAGYGSGPERLGPSALVEGDVVDAEVGTHVVVVHDGADRRRPQPPADGSALQLVASTTAARRVDVYAVVRPGDGEVTYGRGRAASTYRVRAT